MNHHIYDLVKIVTAGTRLDGGCSENAFLELVKQASNDSHMSKENILYYLLEAKNAPIVKIKKPNGNKGYYYAAHSVYSRWNEFGWVDPDLYEDIEAAKN